MGVVPTNNIRQSIARKIQRHALFDHFPAAFGKCVNIRPAAGAERIVKHRITQQVHHLLFAHANL